MWGNDLKNQEGICECIGRRGMQKQWEVIEGRDRWGCIFLAHLFFYLIFLSFFFYHHIFSFLSCLCFFLSFLTSFLPSLSFFLPCANHWAEKTNGMLVSVLDLVKSTKKIHNKVQAYKGAIIIWLQGYGKLADLTTWLESLSHEAGFTIHFLLSHLMVFSSSLLVHVSNSCLHSDISTSLKSLIWTKLLVHPSIYPSIYPPTHPSIPTANE